MFHDLKCSQRIMYIKQNASMYFYQILHSFSCNIYILLKAFLIYVGPKLEYNMSIWSPDLYKDTISVESIEISQNQL